MDFNLPNDTNLHNSFLEDQRDLDWHSEYKRLRWEAPTVLCQKVKGHKDEVLHVAFSPDGTMLSTCSKDCSVKVQ